MNVDLEELHNLQCKPSISLVDTSWIVHSVIVRDGEMEDITVCR